MPKGQIHKYTDEQNQFISDNRMMIIGELTHAFNRKFGTELSKIAMSATRKRRGFTTGRTGRFEKGSTSWNKGMKGFCAGGKSVDTQFKKGRVPGNLKPIGHERICARDGIILIKVAQPNPYTKAATRYRPKHHVIWEQAKGAIPKGFIVRFIDGDVTHCVIENLEMVSKSVNLRMNQMGYSALPAEVKTTAKLVCEVEVAMYSKKRNQQEDQHEHS